MKASLFKFFKSGHGKFFGFLIVVCIALGIISRGNGSASGTPEGKPKTEPAVAPAAAVYKDPLPTEGYSDKRTFVPAFDNAEEQRTLIARQREQLKTLEARKKDTKPVPVKEVVPIAFLPVKPPPAKAPAPVTPVSPSTGLADLKPLIASSDSFAPYGRLIRAKLVTTVDSSALETPVIGLVTHDLFWNRKLLIPANSELHAIARPDRSRNRIDVSGDWVVVLADGGVYPKSSELVVKGIALDMEVTPEKDQFSLTDGSAGLKGKVLTNEDTANSIKLFTASFLSGVAEGFTDRQTNAYGQSQIVPGTQSAAAQGVRAVMDRYADRIMQLIERDGAYVRVPAGKQFYLYLREPLLMAKARLGASLSREIAPAVAEKRSAPDNIRSAVFGNFSSVPAPSPPSPEVQAMREQTRAIERRNELQSLELEAQRQELEKQREAQPFSTPSKTKN
jgi:hypothetical protein